jgi:NAD(P)-dependent dehydrogenase (short-subunit alcohol dehydrogenase family)
VVVVDRDGAGAEAHAGAIGGLAVTADVTRADDWARVVATTTAALGGLDLLHLNAGANSGRQGAPLEDLTDEGLQRALAVNVAGVVLGLRAALPALAAGVGGSVVVTASLAAIRPFPADPVYAAAKTAQVGFVRSVAGELAERGVRINVVCPTATDTPMVSADDRAWLASVGVTPVPPAWIASAVVDAFTVGTTGEVYTAVDATGLRLHEHRQRPAVPRPVAHMDD